MTTLKIVIHLVVGAFLVLSSVQVILHMEFSRVGFFAYVVFPTLSLATGVALFIKAGYFYNKFLASKDTEGTKT
ncbi:MAG TPA: hypothetical protein PK609_01660 [Candidatus Paceibacterota bacterium]|nr:hypothetical protein [Candidatus Paceibacterota bacterium]